VAKPIALIPLNDLSRAKGRLAEMLSPVARPQLALATFLRVHMEAQAAGLEVAVLAAREKDVELFTDMRVLVEQPGIQGLNPQLEEALRVLGSDEVLILHADLPLVSAAEIRTLRDQAPPAPSVALVRSRDGGTNAMLLRPPGLFPLQYGPDSFARHVEAAEAAGATVAAVESELLALDLDTPDDVTAFLAHPASRGSDNRVILERLLRSEAV
jgi:2-phospho-L-lactate guanylyltransferase